MSVPIWAVACIVILLVGVFAAYCLVSAPGAGGYMDFGTPLGCMGVALLTVIALLAVFAVQGCVGWK